MNAAIIVYKYTILPFLEYARFMIIACIMEDMRKLQKYQNKALRICINVKLSDQIRIEDLHARCNIVSLEQRRRIQILMLMCKRRTDSTMHKVFVRDTRIRRRTVFKTDSKEGTLYKRSPYLVGAKLWMYYLLKLYNYLHRPD